MGAKERTFEEGRVTKIEGAASSLSLSSLFEKSNIGHTLRETRSQTAEDS